MSEEFEKWWKEKQDNGYAPGGQLAQDAWEAAQPQWQPIETVSKDMGLTYLLINTREYVTVGYWSGQRNEWLCRDDGRFIAEVTHWQPLPEPPDS